MKIHFERPKNKLLSRYIEGYYFLISEDENSDFTYYTFPNNFQIVSILLNSEIKKEKNSVHVSSSPHKTFISNITYNYTKPIKIRYSGKIKELTIYFKPLGLNKFVNHLAIFFKGKENFAPFLPFDDFEENLVKILNANLIETAFNELEEYLASKFNNQNLNIIEELVQEIELSEISSLSQKYNLSRQYINKLFHQNLGKSPTDFKRIQRFRKSIQSTESKLTLKGLDSLFYDQSHFIKEIKRITNNNPKFFFNEIEMITPNPWLII